MRELDRGVLETSALSELLTVSGLESGTPTAGLAPPAAPVITVTEVLERLGTWILGREEAPLPPGNVEHPVLRLRRLRTLLHLLDVDVSGGDEVGAAPSRARRLRSLRILLDRIERDPPSPLRRTLCAALARACDALVRDELVELSDILVAISVKVRAPGDLEVMAEASMAPEVKDMFRVSAEVARLVATAKDPTAERTFLDAFAALAGTLPPGASPRVEGLRRALLRLARALSRLYKAQALSSLRQGDGGAALEQLEDTVQYAAKLCAGARRRMGLPEAHSDPAVGRAVRALGMAVERSARELEDDLRQAVRDAIDAAREDLPGGTGRGGGQGAGPPGVAAPGGLDGDQHRVSPRPGRPNGCNCRPGCRPAGSSAASTSCVPSGPAAAARCLSPAGRRNGTTRRPRRSPSSCPRSTGRTPTP